MEGLLHIVLLPDLACFAFSAVWYFPSQLPAIKARLASFGLSRTGNKPALLSRLIAHLKETNAPDCLAEKDEDVEGDIDEPDSCSWMGIQLRTSAIFPKQITKIPFVHDIIEKIETDIPNLEFTYLSSECPAVNADLAQSHARAELSMKDGTRKAYHHYGYLFLLYVCFHTDFDSTESTHGPFFSHANAGGFLKSYIKRPKRFCQKGLIGNKNTTFNMINTASMVINGFHAMERDICGELYRLTTFKGTCACLSMCVSVSVYVSVGISVRAARTRVYSIISKAVKFWQ